MSKDIFHSGSIATLAMVPPWAKQLPKESRDVIDYCVGRPYPVIEIDENGLIVLDVSKDVDRLFGGIGNDIRVEPEYLELVG